MTRAKGKRGWILFASIALLPLVDMTCRPGAPSSQAAPNESENAVGGSSLDIHELTDTVQRVADWALDYPFPRDPRHWSMAPLYDGLIDASESTGDPRYLAAVIRAGRRVDFTLGSRTYHADGHAAGHAWLRIYSMDPEENPKILEPFIEQFDEIVQNPIVAGLSFTEEPPPGVRRTDRWSWADALYMSPPTLSLLTKATGNKRYTRFMDSEFRVTYDALFDSEAHLWYRDSSYIGQTTPNGDKVFWSRGNGWVYAGLALVLSYVPDDYATRCFYSGVFQEMSAALLEAQRPEGYWHTSLADPKHVPIGETSGTSLFVFGMAWGVRVGLLDAATYWPAVERGWRAILERIAADGAVSFVQPFGEAPQDFDPTSRVPYGTGTVLMAGSEILRATNAAARISPSALLARALALESKVPDLSTVCDDCVEPKE